MNENLCWSSPQCKPQQRCTLNTLRKRLLSFQRISQLSERNEFRKFLSSQSLLVYITFIFLFDSKLKWSLRWNSIGKQSFSRRLEVIIEKIGCLVLTYSQLSICCWLQLLVKTTGKEIALCLMIRLWIKLKKSAHTQCSKNAEPAHLYRLLKLTIQFAILRHWKCLYYRLYACGTISGINWMFFF